MILKRPRDRQHGGINPDPPATAQLQHAITWKPYGLVPFFGYSCHGYSCLLDQAVAVQGGNSRIFPLRRPPACLATRKLVYPLGCLSHPVCYEHPTLRCYERVALPLLQILAQATRRVPARYRPSEAIRIRRRLVGLRLCSRQEGAMVACCKIFGDKS